MRDLEIAAVKSLEELQKKIVSPSLHELANQMIEQNRRLSDIGRSISLAIPSYAPKLSIFSKTIPSFSEHITKLSNPFQDYIRIIELQSQPFRDLARQFNNLNIKFSFPRIDAFEGLSQVLKDYSRARVVQLKLESEYWLITDQGLIESAATQGFYQNELVILHIINYYKANGWTRLKEVIEGWSPYISQERMKVFESAISLTNENNSSHINYFTVPTLIAQIDGLVRELIALLPTKIKKRVEKQIKEKIAIDVQSKRVDIRQDVAIQAIAEIVDFLSADLLQDIIFDGLFRNSNEITSDENYALFRHKIMHGDKDFLSYNNEENFLRLMLYADFIVDLKKQVQEGILVIDQAA